MLSPNVGAITSQVTSDYRVNNYLMAWAHTLLNTNLYPLSPKPSWFDGVDLLGLDAALVGLDDRAGPSGLHGGDFHPGLDGHAAPSELAGEQRRDLLVLHRQHARQRLQQRVALDRMLGVQLGALEHDRARLRRVGGRVALHRVAGRGGRSARDPLEGEGVDAISDALRALTLESDKVAGDVLISAAPGYEFTDLAGRHHAGGGSHGALHAGDSLGPLLFVGCGPQSADEREQWALRDITPMILAHFGVTT